MKNDVFRSLIVLGILAGGAFAQKYDPIKDAVPQRWIADFTPEDLPELTYPKYFDDLDKARMQVQRGRFRQSLFTLAKAGEVDPVEAGLVRATAQWRLGQCESAIATLSDEKVQADPRAQVLEARVLMSIGKDADAVTKLNEVIKADPDSLAGHFYLGQAYEKVGDLDAARKQYAWFVEDKQLLDKWQGNTGDTIFDDAESVVLIGRAIDRWATLTGAYKDNEALHNQLLNLFVKVYDVIDRGYEPAHVAAAEFYLARDNKEEAEKELSAALDSNPSDVDALKLIATIALDTFNFDAADEVIASIRKVDRTSTVADLLETRSLLQQRRPIDAFAPVQRVLASQPKNLEALGLLAGAHALRLEDDKAADVLKQVEAIDPDNATAYFDVAEQLGAMRQYPRAAEHYKIAIERAPWWTAARNGLGLLYTQSGDEDDARVTLDAAHLLDPFNLATTNYLRLLDELAKFSKSETDHFIVFYDAKADPMIPEYFGEYLESIYKEVCGAFAHEPAVKTYIEVFPTHDSFSVRTTGSPWIGTVGASTGRVIAMVSPRKDKLTMGAFNWAKVLRHEFTHTVTLSATDNRIAHWMTEGLAVLEEKQPLQWAWVPMLYDAVTKKKLFTIEDLTWAFVRPRKPSDRQLAYAESFWICDYIDKTYGREKILAMLAEFKAGKNADETFAKVLGKSTEAFQTEFFAWCDQQVKGWGYDKETSAKVKALSEEAEELTRAGKLAEALPKWEEIHALRPMDKLPRMRLASIYLKQNRTDDAARQLEALDAVELHDNNYAKGIARIYRDAGKIEQATKFAQQAVYIDPYDDAGHQLLAELYEKSGNETGLSREKRVLAALSEWRELRKAENEKAD